MNSTMEAAAAAIRQQWSNVPQLAMILGTGLGHFAEYVTVEATLPYEQLPGFARTTAIAHRGQLVCGSLLGVPLILLDGRCHLYEGYSIAEVTFPIQVMRDCGASTLIVTNASGGLSYHHHPGDIMVIEDHIDLMGRAAPGSSTHVTLRTPRSAPTPYDPQLLEIAMLAAARHQITVHRGVYAAVTGPNYETRAEYAYLRRIGADAVGMSTVPEVQTAASLGMRILGLSVVTNVAHLQYQSDFDAWHVVNAAEHAEPHLRKIVDDVVRSLTNRRP